VARPRFTAGQAHAIGQAIGVDWSTSAFDEEQFRMGLEVELEHGRHDLNTNVTDDDEHTTGKIARASERLPGLLHAPGRDGGGYVTVEFDQGHRPQMPPGEDDVLIRHASGSERPSITDRRPASPRGCPRSTPNRAAPAGIRSRTGFDQLVAEGRLQLGEAWSRTGHLFGRPPGLSTLVRPRTPSSGR
jgi:hypothetical protein